MRDASLGEAENPKPPMASPTESRSNLKMARVLAEDGRVLEGEASPLDLAKTRALYTELVRTRALDLRFVELHRAGVLPSYESVLGEEGAIVAPVLALAADDAVFPGPREALAAVARGVSIEALVHHFLGTARSTTKGHAFSTHLSARAHGVVSVSGVAGAQLPHATGFGWAAKMKKAPRVALAVVSGGAFVTGDFHNALNFAGVSKANVVFVCRLDRGTTLGEISATETVAEKAEAYGLPYARVDGRDALAVWRELSRALEIARSFGGATLVEVVTARTLPSEDGTVTLPEASCPLGLLERHLAVLAAEGGDAAPETAGAALRAKVEAEVETAFRHALAEAERAGPPSRQSMFEDVFAEIPRHLRAQAEALR